MEGQGILPQLLPTSSFVAMARSFALALLALLPLVLAAPLEPRQSITVVSASTISALKPFTHYASTGYCQPANTLAWNCGENCLANPTFEPVASGGDGDGTQFCEFELR